MTTVLVSFATTVVAIAAALGFVWLTRRSETSAEERVADAVRQLDARVEAMSRDLATALEETREETRRHRFLGELVGTIDLDDVIARTLDAAAALPGVDGILIRLSPTAGDPIVESVGLAPHEVEELSALQLPESERLRALSLVYEPPPEPGVWLTAGVAVPLRGAAGAVGLVAAFTRGGGEAFEESVGVALESLALRAAPAIESARRFREARQQADLDALTELHNRRYFHETLAREVARAQRYSRNLALIVFDLDDFKSVNDRIGHLAGDTVLAEVADRVREVVRSADIPCRVGGDEFGVILPESTLEDADQLYARLRAAIAARPLGPAGVLTLSAGVAEIRKNDDPVTFFQRADEALYRAKEAGKGRVVAATAGV